MFTASGNRAPEDRLATLLCARRAVIQRMAMLVALRNGIDALVAIVSVAIVAGGRVSVWPSAAAGIWILIRTAVFRPVLASQLNLSARLQELYDCSLFALPWNTALVGQRPSVEELHSLESRLGPRQRDILLRDPWYPIAAPSTTAEVLSDQGCAAEWDRRLRLLETALASVVLVAVVLGGLAVGLLLHQTLAAYVVTIALPTLPLASRTLEILMAALSARNRRGRLSAAIESLRDDGKQPSKLDLRMIQDALYVARASDSPVPQWLYRRSRDSLWAAALKAASGRERA